MVDETKKIFELLRRHKNELKSFGANGIAIFGSTIRSEDKPESDIDLLVDFDSTKGLFVFIDLKLYLEKLLGKRVDLVTRNALHPALKDKILKEAKNVF